jgi:hypothetical protein
VCALYPAVPSEMGGDAVRLDAAPRRRLREIFG